MGRLERCLWLFGLISAFVAGLVLCQRFMKSPPSPETTRIVMSVGPEDWAVWNERGRARAHRNDFRGALADFDRALELNPKFPMLHNNRGGALLSLGDLQGALKEFDTAVGLDPTYAEARLNRGQTRSELSDRDGAIQDLEKALALTDESWPFRAFTVQKLNLIRKTERKARVY